MKEILLTLGFLALFFIGSFVVSLFTFSAQRVFWRARMSKGDAYHHSKPALNTTSKNAVNEEK